MTRCTLVLGDVEHDPLLTALVPELIASDRDVTVLSPTTVADLVGAATETRMWFGPTPVDEVIFRLSLELLVAPSFADEDQSFVANELRAFWTHVLCLPTVATLNDGRATSVLLRDPGAWRAALRELGVEVAPATMGTIGAGSWWLRDRGDVVPLPPEGARRALGVTAVAATGLRAVLCCGGEGRDDAARPAARALASRGVGLAEVVIDDRHRLVSVVTDPPIDEADAAWAAGRAKAWLDAAARR